MADSNIASGSIEDAKRAIQDRFATSRLGMTADDADAQVDEKLANVQDKTLVHMGHLPNLLFALLLADIS